VSKRATGLVSGFVGAGGNAGGAVTQAIFFTYSTLPVDKAFVWMGVMTVVSGPFFPAGPASARPSRPAAAPPAAAMRPSRATNRPGRRRPACRPGPARGLALTPGPYQPRVLPNFVSSPRA
jgi:hypothetical protein